MKRHLVVAIAQAPLAAFEFSGVAQIFGVCPDPNVRWYEFAAAAKVPGRIASTSGLEVVVPNGLDILESADTIVIPSWERGCAVPDGLLARLTAAHGRGARLVAIGSGVILLAATGLLDGVTVAAGAHADALILAHPAITLDREAPYKDGGQLVTSAGGSAAIGMLLALVRRDHGIRIFNMVSHGIGAGRSTAPERPARRPDMRLVRTMDYLKQNAAKPVRTEEMAAMAQMSPRQFNRKFRQTVGRSPYDWLLHQRVAIAKQLLAGSSLSIEEVGAEAGFGSTVAFRSNFVNIVGLKPNSFRRAQRMHTPRGELAWTDQARTA